MKIIYILSLARSGSTIIDYTLGRHPDLIGLGEVVKVLRLTKEELISSKIKNRKCSCGKLSYDCDFWGSILENFKNFSDSDFAEKYNYILNYFQQKYGDNKILIDSSKGRFKHIKDISKVQNVFFIYLTRDIRGWLYSMRKNGKKNVLKNTFIWYYANKNRKVYFKDCGMNVNLGYDEFALDPKFILNELFNNLDIKNIPISELETQSNSHILFGNSTSGDKEKRSQVKYDPRWLYENSNIGSFALLFPFFKNINNTAYSNLMKNDIFSVERKKIIRKEIRDE